MNSHITLLGLSVEGPGKVPATVPFGPGLNAIVGATGTGKSYVFQAIDFCLGSGKQPKSTKHGDGYRSARLTLRTDMASIYMLEREFAGEKILLSPVHEGMTSILDGSVLSAKHSDDDKSLSWWLLKLLGLQGLKIVHNIWRERRSFSFRHLAHLAMVDENRIIAEKSPAVTGGPSDPNQTSDKRAFNTLITGLGDEPLARPITKTKDRNLSIDGKIEWIAAELLRLEGLVDQFSKDGDTIETLLADCDQAIEGQTAIIIATKARVTDLENRRQESRKALIATSDLKSGLSERLKRFLVLRKFYDTDAERIEATLEAGHVFERLPGGQCAICGMIADHTAEHPAAKSFEEFATAARSELSKLDRLKLELDETMSTQERERSEYEVSEKALRTDLESIEREIAETLKPQAHASAEELRRLMRIRSDIVRAQDACSSIARLKVERLGLEKEKARAVTKPPKPESVASGSIKDFCQVVTETLHSWQFDLESNVSFDEQAFDLVINGQARSSLGKGHRALTHAAFTVSIMRYCLAVGLPHPGFVILDSPLNPFKGKMTREGNETVVSREVQDAFYTDLARRPHVEQYVVIENTEVPLALVPDINHITFSGNDDQPRAGFFPPLSVG